MFTRKYHEFHLSKCFILISYMNKHINTKGIPNHSCLKSQVTYFYRKQVKIKEAFGKFEFGLTEMCIPWWGISLKIITFIL